MRALLLVLVGCGRIAFDPRGDAGDGGATGDGVTPACQTFGTWSTPMKLAQPNSAADDWEPALSPDGNVLVFGIGNSGLSRAMRTGPTTFGPAMPIPALALNDVGPTWSPNGDRLYFASDRSGPVRLWQSDYVGGVFQTPTQVIDPFLDNEPMNAPYLRADGLELVWSTAEPTAQIRRAIRPTTSSAWADTGTETQLTLPGGQSGWPALSADGLTLYFEGKDAAGPKIYTSTRTTTLSAFGPPTLLSELGVSNQDDAGDPELSRDGLTLVMSFQPQAMTTLFDIYISTRVCLD